MEKLSKAKEMYHLKNEELDSCGTKVTPKEFYRDLFPVGSFERKMMYDDQKPKRRQTTERTGGERLEKIESKWNESSMQ